MNKSEVLEPNVPEVQEEVTVVEHTPNEEEATVVEHTPNEEERSVGLGEITIVPNKEVEGLIEEQVTGKSIPPFTVEELNEWSDQTIEFNKPSIALTEEEFEKNLPMNMEIQDMPVDETLDNLNKGEYSVLRNSHIQPIQRPSTQNKGEKQFHVEHDSTKNAEVTPLEMENPSVQPKMKIKEIKYGMTVIANIGNYENIKTHIEATAEIEDNEDLVPALEVLGSQIRKLGRDEYRAVKEKSIKAQVAKNNNNYQNKQQQNPNNQGNPNQQSRQQQNPNNQGNPNQQNRPQQNPNNQGYPNQQNRPQQNPNNQDYPNQQNRPQQNLNNQGYPNQQNRQQSNPNNQGFPQGNPNQLHQPAPPVTPPATSPAMMGPHPFIGPIEATTK